ncbi:hypothetical protein C8Q80DRAFT_1125296 [Daedaleopsis nitida]|nr:hypothetical protein C8Q80DRAFT_1125296 [Daedaleopsis nitida]
MSKRDKQRKAAKREALRSARGSKQADPSQINPVEDPPSGSMGPFLVSPPEPTEHVHGGSTGPRLTPPPHGSTHRVSGSSLGPSLTPLEDMFMSLGERSRRDIDQISPRSSHSIGQRNLMDEVGSLVTRAQQQFDELQGDLTDCLAMQKKLTERFHTLHQSTREERASIQRTITDIRARFLVGDDGTDDQRESVSAHVPDEVKEEDVTSPHSPVRSPSFPTVPLRSVTSNVVLPSSNNHHHLFRDHDMDETLSVYRDRRSAQNHVLAREHYEDGVRERDRQAVKWWRRYGPDRDPDDGDDSSSDSDTVPSTNANRSITSSRGSQRPGRGSRNEDRDQRAGRGGAGGNSGGPPDPSSSSSDDERGSSNARHGGRPHRRPPVEDKSKGRHQTRPQSVVPYMPPRELARSPSYLHPEDSPLVGRGSDPNAKYIEQQLHAIRLIIRRRVDMEIEERSTLKNLKNVPSPEKYNGRDDAEEFMTWLRALLRWLEIHRVVGPDLDGDRVTVLGQFLTGAAMDWYDETVDTMHPQGRVWVFEDAVCAMFKRFIHRSTARYAADKFNAARYSKTSGINGLWEYMVKWAMKMPRYPDDYTFNRKFVEALPEEIAIPMFRNKGVSVERSSPALLKHIALEQEENNRVVDEYRSSHRAAPRAADNTAGRFPAPGATRTSGSGSLPLRQAAGFRSGARRMDRMSNRPGDRDARPADATGLRDMRTPIAGARTTVVTAPTTGTVPRAPAAAVATASSQPIRCYNCNKEGHISSNCPQPRVTHQRAARVTDESILPPCAVPGSGPDDPANPPAQSPLVEDEERPTHAVATVESEAMDPDDMNSEQLGEYLENEYQVYAGSQYDSDDYYAAQDYMSEDGDNDVYFGMMRRSQYPDDSDAESDLSVSGHSTSQSDADSDSASRPYDIISTDFVDLTRTEVLHQGSALGLAIYEASMNRLAELNTAQPTEDFDDMPPLMDEDESATHADESIHQQQAEAQYNDQFTSIRSSAEVPLASEAMDAWNEFEHGPRSELDFNRMRAMMFRLVGANQYLCATLEQERESRTQLQQGFTAVQDEHDRLHAHIAWSRREIGWALDREQATITAMNSAVLHRAETLNEARERIRIREVMLNNPLSPDLTDDMFEGDYLDDPSMSTANQILQHAIAQGPNPPAYSGRGPALRAMTSSSLAVAPPTMPADMTTRARTGRRPIPRRLEQTCLSMLMRVNGLEALVLLDSGSTGDSISPDFARVCGATILELENPATLQLGCVGSRSRINRGVRVPITVGSFSIETYLDVVNLDRYDVVLGTPFMRRFGVLLDFGTSCVTIRGTSYATLTPREEDHHANRRCPVTGQAMAVQQHE